MRLHELMNYRLEELETKKSSDYLRENRRYFKKALKVWGKDTYVSEVSKAMVNDLLIKESKRLKRKGKGNWKVNSMLRSLKALWNYGNRVHDLNLKNPCNLEFFPIDIKTKYIPPAEDIEAVKAECNAEQKLIIEFVDETACRIMEAVRFAHEDIDGELITLWTRKSRNSNLTPRRIPKPECINRLEGKGKIFNYSRLPRFLERKISKLEQKTWSWHNLRHRRASIWANNGMNLFEISHRLGHGTKTKNRLIFHDIRRTVKTNMVEAGVDKAHRDLILGHSLKGMDVYYIAPTEKTLAEAMARYTEWVERNLETASANVTHPVTQSHS